MAFSAKGFSEKFTSMLNAFGETVENVATSTNMDINILTNIEQGTNEPTGDQLLILSEYFKSDIPWLIDDDAENPDKNTEILLRSESERISPSDRHAIAEFVHLCKSQAFAEELLEQKSSEEQFKIKLSGTYYKGQGIACASKFRKWNQLPSTAIVPDIFDWLRQAGIRVFRRSLPHSEISGLFIRHPLAGPCILINYSEDVYRQRFSAAHEAGHAIMDSKEFNVSDEGDFQTSDFVELRANMFASCFLIPKELLLKLGTPDQWKRPEKIIEVASRLTVSVPALLSALRREELIDEPTRGALREMYLRPEAKQDAELGGNLNPRELKRKKLLLERGLHTSYVHQCFEIHHRGFISNAKLADMLLVDMDELSELALIYRVSSVNG